MVKARNYDFRHHAVSRGLESPCVSVQSATDYYGWISPKMIRRYSQPSVAALRAVAAAIDKKSLQRETRRERQKKVPRGATTSERSNRPSMKTGKLLVFRPRQQAGRTKRDTSMKSSVRSAWPVRGP